MSRNRRRWRIARRVLLGAFLATVAVLLVRAARAIQWQAVGAALGGYEAPVLLAAAGMALASHLTYASFDLLGRRYAGHALDRLRTLVIAAVSYAFNLNMGALVGGAGFRFRLYSQFGLRAGQITRVLAFSVATNWSGYMLLLGGVLAAGLVAIPGDWRVGETPMRTIGIVLLLAAAAWPLACAFSPRREWTLRGHTVQLPGWRMALLQLGLSACNWALIAAIVYLLLDARIAYPTVLGALLLGAVAGAVTHVPAGLGVLEAVFVMILSDQVPRAELIAALLAYRGVYYIGPLLLGLVAYLLLEADARRRELPMPSGAGAKERSSG